MGGPVNTVEPRDVSTGSNLASIAVRLETVHGQLSNCQDKLAGGTDTKAQMASPGGGDHSSLLNHIMLVLSAIENQVEFISARL